MNSYQLYIVWIILFIAALSASPQASQAGEIELADELIFYLPFENSLVGTEGETPRNAAGEFVPGIHGQGLRLSGEGLDYPLEDNLDPYQGTISLWFRPDWDGQPFPNCHMFMAAGDGAWPNRMEFCSDGAPNYRILFWDPSGREMDIGYPSRDWKAGEWMHLAATWEGRDFALYKDGELLERRTNRPIPVGLSTSLRVGSTILNRHPARGTFDEVRVYRVALTAEEIAVEAGRPVEIETDPPEIVDETTPSPESAVSGEVLPSTPLQELFYLSFDNTWAGAQNETPYQLKGTFVPGVIGQALHLTDGGLNYPQAGNIDVNQGTVECWFKPDWGGSSSVVSYAFFGAGDGMWNNWLELMRDGAVNYRIIFWDLKGYETGIGYHVADWAAGEWRHLAATWDGSAFALYMNGELITSKDQRQLPDHPRDTIYVGYNGHSDLICHGALDELRVYDRALTPSEVAAHYTATRPLPAGDLDGDERLTGLDLFMLGAAWHEPVDVLRSRMDLKRDGLIDEADVRAFTGLRRGTQE